MSTSAAFTLAAISGASTRRGAGGSKLSTLSYGVSAAKCRRCKRAEGCQTPSFRMMPISSASASGRSAELPIAVAYDATRDSNG